MKKGGFWGKRNDGRTPVPCHSVLLEAVQDGPLRGRGALYRLVQGKPERIVSIGEAAEFADALLGSICLRPDARQSSAWDLSWSRPLPRAGGQRMIGAAE